MRRTAQSIMDIKGGDTMEKKDGNCKMSTFMIAIAILVGMLFGGLCGIWWGTQRAALEKNVITYGISGQNLHVRSVVWKDFPTWREVAFSIDGSISFVTEQNGRIALDALANPEALEEIHREHNVASNGKALVFYDEVTYVINEGVVSAEIPKIYHSYNNAVVDTVNNSFYMVFREKDTECIAGSIFPLQETYTVWTKEQAKYSDTNIDTYLSAFTLSGTYGGNYPLCERAQKEGVILQKEEGSFLDCTIYNQGADVWCYEAQLPHVELWYKGVWIELISPFANNLVIAEIEPGQNRGFDVPAETIMMYPALIDGIYRLVVYGENEEFVASEIFIVED